MGVMNSKCERRSDAVRLCKERKRFLKQAIDSRCALAAAHNSYIQSLRNLGIALRKYAESEISIESSRSISAIDPDKNPSPMAQLSYMRSGESSALTVGVSLPARNMYLEEGEFSTPPPPPPFPESGFSWDFFYRNDECDNYSGLNMNLDPVRMFEDFGEKNETNGISKPETPRNELVVYNAKSAPLEQSNLKRNKSPLDKDTSVDAGDQTEFVTHMAKDFLSSIKDIDSLFFRASESAKEVSTMLESNKVRVENRGRLPALVYLTSFGVVCCQGRNINVSDGTYGRTTKGDNEDSRSDFIEDLCMISGSHSSTLDKMYTWERKLYDEVKASEFIGKEYDRKRDKLRHQFAKNLSPQAIDKTRAIVRDLHSRISVALHAVDSISKRIEKMRDEELLPQVLELIQGLTRMWKSMVKCHNSQHIIMSLVDHAKSFNGSETHKQIVTQLLDEVECFRLSFIAWIYRYMSYVEALNSWLQICILQPQERYRGRRAFSPRRVLPPPIIVLYCDWSTAIKSLPAGEVSNAVKVLLSNLQRSVRCIEMHKNEEMERKDEGKNDDPFNLRCIETSLTEVFDRLTKFTEASAKLCEDICQKCEEARIAYNNYKAPPSSFSI